MRRPTHAILLAAATAAALTCLTAFGAAQAVERPAHELERFTMPTVHAGDGQGEFLLPTGSSGFLFGELLHEGEPAYDLQASLTTYLPAAGARDTRYGGIEGVLIPRQPQYIVPGELHVLGAWSQRLGEDATFQAHVVEVNSVTGYVYGAVGGIQGSFAGQLGLRPGAGPRIAAAVRFDGNATTPRVRDAAPPEAGCEADLRPIVRVPGKHVPGDELDRKRGDDIPPPPAGQGDPDAAGHDVHTGAVGTATPLTASGNGLAHDLGRPLERSFDHPFDDPPPRWGPDLEVPGLDGHGVSGNVRPAVAAGGIRRHAGGAVDGLARPVPPTANGVWFATWVISR